MNASPKANRKTDGVALKYRSGRETLPVRALNEDKLRQLLTFMSQLANTPAGAAELERRLTLFGECKRRENETSIQFCARLRHWLDRDLPKKKSPFRSSWQMTD